MTNDMMNLRTLLEKSSDVCRAAGVVLPPVFQEVPPVV